MLGMFHDAWLVLSPQLPRALGAPSPSSRHRLSSYASLSQTTTKHVSPLHFARMDAEALKQYLADNPPTVVQLEIKPHFEALNEKEKHYAHHASM